MKTCKKNFWVLFPKQLCSVLEWSVLVAWLPCSVQAGVVAAVGPRWQVASEGQAATERNYYGVGADLMAGYSVGQVLDLALWGEYTPMSLKNTEAGRDDALNHGFGAQIGLRLQKSCYIGMRGGRYHWQVLKRQHEEELHGSWNGNGAGLVLGGLWEFTKAVSSQIQFEAHRSVLSREDATSEPDDDKLFDIFSVTWSIVLSGQENGWSNPFY